MASESAYCEASYEEDSTKIKRASLTDDCLPMLKDTFVCATGANDDQDHVTSRTTASGMGCGQRKAAGEWLVESRRPQKWPRGHIHYSTAGVGVAQYITTRKVLHSARPTVQRGRVYYGMESYGTVRYDTLHYVMVRFG